MQQNYVRSTHREVALMVNNNVAGLTSSLRSNNPLGANNLSSEGSLVLVHIDRNGRLIPVRTGLKEVLGQSPSRKLGEGKSSGSKGGTGSYELFGVVNGFDDLDDFLGLSGGQSSRRESGSGKSG